MRKCSLFEWVDVAQQDSPRGVHFHNPPRIVEIKPYLNFAAPDAKNVEHYQSAFRFGLLAYVAFPNSEWRTVSELMGLPGATCEALLSAFVSDAPRPSLPPPAEQWGECPSFLRSKWEAEKAKETRAEKSELRKREAAIPSAQRGSVQLLTWNLCMDGPLVEARIGGVMEVLRRQRPHVVCFQEVISRIRALLNRPRDWFSLGLTPVSHLPAECRYGAMILTGLPVQDTARTSLPDTSQMRDFVEARLAAPWGEDIVVSTAHFDSPAGKGMVDAKASHLRMAAEWVGKGGARICDGDFNWTADDGEMDRIYANTPHVSDLWGAMMPGDPGYTYNGAANMNATPGMQGRLDRILCTSEVRAIARSVELVGTKPIRRISCVFPGRSQECQVRPSDHFGVVADFSTTEAAAAGRGVTARRVSAHPDLENIGDAPDEEHNIISRCNFAPRGVTAARMRDALLSLEIAPPNDTSAAATIAMVRIAYPDTARWMKYTTKTTLKAAIGLLRLSCSGNKTQLVERISHAFGVPPRTSRPPLTWATHLGGGLRGAGGRDL